DGVGVAAHLLQGRPDPRLPLLDRTPLSTPHSTASGCISSPRRPVRPGPAGRAGRGPPPGETPRPPVPRSPRGRVHTSPRNLPAATRPPRPPTTSCRSDP